MNLMKKYSLRESYVLVKKLPLATINRITINPFLVRKKCDRCKEYSHEGIECSHCSKIYHYDCLHGSHECCGTPLLPSNPKECAKCQKTVYFGPVCNFCKAQYHNACVGPYDECCRINLCDPTRRECRKCSETVYFGPSCPICKKSYHAACIETDFFCCEVEFDDSKSYKCHRCKRFAKSGCLMCTKCCKIFHTYCISRVKQCCGKPLSLEVYFITSFKYLTDHFNVIIKRKAALNHLESMVTRHSRRLRSNSDDEQTDRMKRVRKTPETTKPQQAEADDLDCVEIVSVKGEIEEEMSEIAKSPPVLTREMCYTPEASTSSLIQKPDSTDHESLKGFFDYLYNVVRKLPPQAQAQVKLDIFKTVIEAEMRN